jgi:hypothetical protein
MLACNFHAPALPPLRYSCAGAPVPLVYRLRDITQVFDSIVLLVAVNVVDLM